MKRICSVLILLLVSAALVSGQTMTGDITGEVTDETGAVIPGVTVTLESPQLLGTMTAVTGPSGTFRFTKLVPGTYQLTFELQGFTTITRSGIIVESGRTADLRILMPVAPVAETVTVSGESPVVDTKRTVLASNYVQSHLQEIPTARDPWVFLDQTPGLYLDRVNVGGNESGQQSNFVMRGDSGNNTMWNVDGVTITDQAAIGASPTYFDFDSFEEIQLTTGANDPSLQTGGLGINLVTKQGSNQIRGQGSFYGLNSDLQWDNITPELQDQGAGAGAPLKRILDYGFDVGGPIQKDKIWFWGAYRVQDINRGIVGFLKPGATDPNDPNSLADDPTKLTNYNFKINTQLTDDNRFTFFFTRGDKTRDARGASSTRPLETTFRQSGPTNVYKFEDLHVFSDKFLLTGKFAYIDGGFRLDYQDPALRNVQTSYDYATGFYGRSYLDYATERPQYQSTVDGDYFLEQALGGDHQFKFGFQYRKTPVESFTTYGGDAWAVFDGGAPSEVWLFRPGDFKYDATIMSGWVGDTYTQGRMTMNLGARWDYQTGNEREAAVTANQVAPDLLPALSSGGREKPFTWNNFSPRLGLTWDTRGDGKTIAKASFARYYDQVPAGNFSFAIPTGVSEVDYPWADLNGDGFVQRNEIDTSTVLFTSNFDPNNPNAVVSPNRIDPDFSAPTTDEMILGIQHEAMPDFAVGFSYIWKNFQNLEWEDWWNNDLDRPRPGISNADFVPVTFTEAGSTGTYYQLPFTAPGGEILTNWPDYYQRYNGFEFTARKRLSHRWYANGSFTYNLHREYFDSEAAILDPTGIDLRDGGDVGYPTEGSGKEGIFMNSRWMLKFQGMVQLPYEINLSANLNARQGFPFPQVLRSPRRTGGIGRVEIPLVGLNDDRYSKLWLVDLRAEKFIEWGRTRVYGTVDLFNLLNSNTVLQREWRLNLATANDIREILSPRALRFGVRVTF